MTHIYLAALTGNLRTQSRNVTPISDTTERASANAARKMIAMLAAIVLVPVLFGAVSHTAQMMPDESNSEVAIYRR